MPQMTTRQRRQVVTWCLAHGKDVAATCARFGVSQATVYRWLARYAAHPAKPLRMKSRRPAQTRQPSWTHDTLCQLSDLVVFYPRATRRQWQHLLTNETGFQGSEGTLGKMWRVIARGCPVCGRKHHKHLLRKHIIASFDAGLRRHLETPTATRRHALFQPA